MNQINQITRDDIVEFDALPTMNAYQAIATKSAFYPGQGTPLGLIYCAVKLNGEAGELAEHTGKAMRDDGLISVHCEQGASSMGPVEIRFALMTPARQAALIKEGGDVLWYLSALCNELGITLEELARCNLSKLCDRTERDKLRGSGDER